MSRRRIKPRLAGHKNGYASTDELNELFRQIMARPDFSEELAPAPGEVDYDDIRRRGLKLSHRAFCELVACGAFPWPDSPCGHFWKAQTAQTWFDRVEGAAPRRARAAKKGGTS